MPKFTPENRKNIPKRGPSKRKLMIDAIKAECGGDEETFLRSVVRIGLGKNEDGSPAGDGPNATVLSLALQRLEPPLKAVQPAVSFEFDENAKPHEQAKQVMNAASSGKITPDVAKIFLDGLGMMLRIEEVTDLKERLEKLESSLDE